MINQEHLAAIGAAGNIHAKRQMHIETAGKAHQRRTIVVGHAADAAGKAREFGALIGGQQAEKIRIVQQHLDRHARVECDAIRHIDGQGFRARGHIHAKHDFGDVHTERSSDQGAQTHQPDRGGARQSGLDCLQAAGQVENTRNVVTQQRNQAPQLAIRAHGAQIGQQPGQRCKIRQQAGPAYVLERRESAKTVRRHDGDRRRLFGAGQRRTKVGDADGNFSIDIQVRRRDTSGDIDANAAQCQAGGGRDHARRGACTVGENRRSLEITHQRAPRDHQFVQRDRPGADRNVAQNTAGRAEGEHVAGRRHLEPGHGELGIVEVGLGRSRGSDKGRVHRGEHLDGDELHQLVHAGIGARVGSQDRKRDRGARLVQGQHQVAQQPAVGRGVELRRVVFERDLAGANRGRCGR